LPTWLKGLFWGFVAVEWTIAAALLAVVTIPIWHGPTRRAVVDMLCLDDSSTRYAAGYSPEGWSTIRVGDSEDAVVTKIGEPLHRWPDGSRALWSWSTQKAATDNYLERKLIFDERGRVIEKHEECYID
jgi:hypothetical protein